MTGIMLNGNQPNINVIQAFAEKSQNTFNQMYKNIDKVSVAGVLETTNKFLADLGELTTHYDGFGKMGSAISTAKGFSQGKIFSSLLKLPIECLEIKELLYDKANEKFNFQDGDSRSIKQMIEDFKSQIDDEQKDSIKEDLVSDDDNDNNNKQLSSCSRMS